MRKKFTNLQLHQMDSALNKLRGIGLPSRLGNGWVKAIRESLGMSASALARKLDVIPASIAKPENAEADEKITLISAQADLNAWEEMNIA